jgi:tRNA-uridine 2-sulfurtransferase
VRIDAARKQVVVGPREALLTASLSLKETNWLGDAPTIEAACAAGQPVLVRVRSTREPALAHLAMIDGAPGVAFAAPEEGVSPGQACVLYDAGAPTRVLGGGFIAATTAAFDGTAL